MMETEEESSLPKMYASDKDGLREDSVDHESLLLGHLSLLSTLGDFAPCIKPRFLDRQGNINCNKDFGVVDWMFKAVSKKCKPFSAGSNDGCEIDHERGPLLREWSKSLQHIQDLIPHINPFELHILARQSILFLEESTTSYRILCLLLGTIALRQCPSPLEKRWKRWQSLVCETLRMFQDSIPLLDSENATEDSSGFVLSLMILHIVPACLHVIYQLPTENSYHVAMFSSLLGTSCNVLERKMVQCQKQLSGGTEDFARVSSNFEDSCSIIYDTLQLIRSSFERFGVFSEMSVWIDPVIPTTVRKENRIENVDFLMHRNKLSWWVHRQDEYEPEERIANMDTSVDKAGLALLAMKAFQQRPMVYHPNFVWRVWLPHAIVLLEKSDECPTVLERSTSLFLESLVRMVPKSSLEARQFVCGNPDTPVELFLALSNRLVSRIQKDHKGDEETDEGKEETNISPDEEAEFKMRSKRTVSLTKALLSRFTTVCQVQIVTKLVKECSIPGLQARFLDLLRPAILIPDHQAEKLIWELLVAILDDLFKKYWDKNEQNLVDINNLISRDVEMSVGAITMIQMWSMVEGKKIPVNGGVISNDLRGFQAALKKLLRRWSEDSSLAPQLHYRLFLLDNAIDNTLENFLYSE